LSLDIHSSSRGKHVVLLYKDSSEREIATIDYLNVGLKEGQLSIYASVDACDQLHLAKISSKIVDFKENINKRNLLIVNLKPFYDSALKGDLTPFENLRKQILEELERRGNNNKSVIIVADCADNLFQNQYFDQSQLVESWWHHVYTEWIRYDNNQGQQEKHITVVCPHLDLILHKHPFDQHKCKILDNHSVTIDMAGHTIMKLSTLANQIEGPTLQPATEPINSQMESQSHILIAESEPELRFIYGMWLKSKGFKNILVADSGRRCFEECIRIGETQQKSDVIFILDSHIKDIPYIELVREIINRRPDSLIILTTTFPLDIINPMCININSSNVKILLKPFKLSKLLPLIGHSS
jgi:hypothetical protein